MGSEISKLSDAEIETHYFDNCVSAEPNTGCWIWTGCVVKDCYGIISRHGVKISAHRAMWQFRNGPMPRDRFACHSCDTPCCVNPDHVWPGTQADNLKDARHKGRPPGRQFDHANRVQCRVTVAVAQEAAADPNFPLSEAIKLLRRAYKRRTPEDRDAKIAAALAKREAA